MTLFRPRHVSMATLRNSFDRRSLVIGGVQGGLGILLADFSPGPANRPCAKANFGDALTGTT